jgi:hypothetical protein
MVTTSKAARGMRIGLKNPLGGSPLTLRQQNGLGICSSLLPPVYYEHMPTTCQADFSHLADEK